MTTAVLTGTGAAHVTGTGSGFVTHRGDDRIPTCVEIGYDNPWTFGVPSGQWVDVTSDVRALTTTRGRNAELQRFETGTATIKISNRTGNYSRWIGSGVNIGCPIRVRISAEKSDPTGTSPSIIQYDPTDGGFYYAWYGYIESIASDWTEGGMSDAWITVTAADGFTLLNRSDLIGATFSFGDTHADFDPFSLPFVTGFSLQYGHDRFLQVIAASSGVKPQIPGLYIKYDTTAYSNGSGSGTCPKAPIVDSSVVVNENALSHLQAIAEAAFIDLYVRPDGYVCWRPFSEVRDQTFDGATIFGDSTGEIPYSDLSPYYSDENLFNDATITLVDATVSTSTDATSIAAYGRRAFQQSVPVYPNMTDGASNGFAAARYASGSTYVARYKDPIVHCPSITVDLRALTDAQRMRVLTLPIGYRVEVKRRPTAGDTLTAECHFEGVRLTWSPGMNDVQAVLNLAPVRPAGSYALG